MESSGQVEIVPNPPFPDPNPVPPPDSIFVPVVADPMDWRPSTEAPQNDNQPHIPSDDSTESTPPPVRQDPPDPPDPPAEPVHADEEHAYWAEFEDDPSTPSEAELKEFVSTEDSCYSACRCRSYSPLVRGEEGIGADPPTR